MKIILSLMILFLSLNSFAKNSSLTAAVTIKTIYFYSKSDSLTMANSHKGLVQVMFTGVIPWTAGSDCLNSSVIVREDDAHIISALMTAKVTSSPIYLYADDANNISTECYLRAIGY